MGRNCFQAFDNLETFKVRRHDEGRQTLCAGCFAGSCKKRVDVGDTTIGNPGLFTVEHVGITIVGGGHGRIGNV